jgi:predicted transcriptional regulator
MDIRKVLAQKKAALLALQADIEVLERAQRIAQGVGVSVSRVNVKKLKRAPRGAKKAKVLGAMTAKPQRTTDIAKKAGVTTQNAASVIQAGVKRGEIKKGRKRGMYLLVKRGK